MNPSELETGVVGFFFHYCCLFCFVLFFSKGLFQRKLAQSITHRCQLCSPVPGPECLCAALYLSLSYTRLGGYLKGCG